jgi:hypothetical protein
MSYIKTACCICMVYGIYKVLEFMYYTMARMFAGMFPRDMLK